MLIFFAFLKKSMLVKTSKILTTPLRLKLTCSLHSVALFKTLSSSFNSSFVIAFTAGISVLASSGIGGLG
ncbi:hypothetical protein [Helicobacter pylori]|uniref:hypothetical protein n=1 Tax=Helicobacter pylori TaxID=210 RepID=UPI0018ACF16B|nr:hypothetical protein [Helicobacter pylori]